VIYSWKKEEKYMMYVLVKYDNGNRINKIFPIWFNWLNVAESAMERLNEKNIEQEEKWKIMPMVEYG
jgi:hypothetical protein